MWLPWDEQGLRGQMKAWALTPWPPCPGTIQSYRAGAGGGKRPSTWPGPPPAWALAISLAGCVLRGLWVCNGHRPLARAGQGEGAGAELGSHLVPPDYGATSLAPPMSHGTEQKAGPRRPAPSSPTQGGPGRSSELLWCQASRSLSLAGVGGGTSMVTLYCDRALCAHQSAGNPHVQDSGQPVVPMASLTASDLP